MVSITDNAVTKLNEMKQEDPSKGAFRVVFKGFG
jgi:Fe-S cluster assembly iron-binding protein IscA